MAGFSFISLRWWWLCLAATGPWPMAQGQYGQRSLGFNLTLLTRLDNFYHDF